MRSIFTIDRFEGSDWAVLEEASAKMITVPRVWLPTEALEGDVVQVSGEIAASETVLRITVDRQAYAARTEQTEGLANKLPRGPKGDISL